MLSMSYDDDEEDNFYCLEREDSHMANVVLQVKRLCLDIEEFLEYPQSEDLLSTIAEVVNWLKKDARTVDGREKRLTSLRDTLRAFDRKDHTLC